MLLYAVAISAWVRRGTSAGGFRYDTRRLTCGFLQRLIQRHRPAEVWRVVGIPGEALDTWRAKIVAAVSWVRISVIDNPVFLTVGRLEEAVVSWAKDTGTRIGTKEWVVDLSPALRIERIGVKVGLKHAKSVEVRPAAGR